MKRGKFEVVVDQCYEYTVNSGIFLMKFLWPDHPEIKPGQFVVLEPLNKQSVMPRPFSDFDVNTKSASILFKVVGENTKLYSKLKPGDKIKISGPKGTPIPIDKNINKYIFVSGGVGVAGIMFSIKELHSLGKSVTVLLGAYNDTQVVGTEEFSYYQCDLKIITEVGNGRNGFVTELLKEELAGDQGRSVVIACGPIPMLNAVADITAKSNNKCYVLLEEIMACGGSHSCLGCAVPMEDKQYKHVCFDGPAFDAAKVNWDELMKRYKPTPITVSQKVDDPMRTVLVGQKGRQLILHYPFMFASGCKGVDALKEGDITYAGAIVTKGKSLNLIIGNPGPRVCETPSGMLNAIGLENSGLETFIRDELLLLLKFKLPIIVNIFGKTIEEYGEIARQLEKTKIAGIEVNISCPNVKEGGMIFGVSPKMTARVIKEVRQKAPSKFIITKLTPAAGASIVDVARAAKENGSDAISLINTIPGMSINPWARKSRIGNVIAGLSGPAIRPVAVRFVRQLYIAGIGPLIGIGGISGSESAAEFFMAGAKAVQVGTESFKKDRILTNIHDGLVEIMDYHGAKHTSDLVIKQEDMEGLYL